MTIKMKNYNYLIGRELNETEHILIEIFAENKLASVGDHILIRKICLKTYESKHYLSKIKKFKNGKIIFNS